MEAPNTSKTNDFTPLDLNENNVKIIFKRCLAKEEDKDKYSYRLFRKEKRI